MDSQSNNTNNKIRIRLGITITTLLLLFIVLILALIFVIRKGRNESAITTEFTTTKETTGERTTEAVTQAVKEELSQEELTEMSELVSSSRYYGFVCCEYQDATQINWNEVLYTGAGLDAGPLTDVQTKEYLQVSGMDEMYTDVTVIKGVDLESFVKETTGTDYGDAKRPLDWTYLQGDDLYISMHGDTNYQAVSFTSGTHIGDIYTLHYNGMIYEDFNNYDMVLTVQFSDQQCVFISNVKEGTKVPEKSIQDSSEGDVDSITE